MRPSSHRLHDMSVPAAASAAPSCARNGHHWQTTRRRPFGWPHRPCRGIPSRDCPSLPTSDVSADLDKKSPGTETVPGSVAALDGWVRVMRRDDTLSYVRRWPWFVPNRTHQRVSPSSAVVCIPTATDVSGSGQFPPAGSRFPRVISSVSDLLARSHQVEQVLVFVLLDG